MFSLGAGLKGGTEYQIFIGCNDPYLNEEIVSERQLREMVSSFFERNEVDFSMLSLQGGYLHDDGRFVIEDTLCINIIGGSDLDIIRLGRSLAMFMGQETVLITRNALQVDFR